MLVIFDCDGVLVESEALAAQAFSQVLARHGIGLSARQCEALFIGKTLTQCFDALHERYPAACPLIFASNWMRPVSDCLPIT